MFKISSVYSGQVPIHSHNSSYVRLREIRIWRRDKIQVVKKSSRRVRSGLFARANPGTLSASSLFSGPASVQQLVVAAIIGISIAFDWMMSIGCFARM